MKRFLNFLRGIITACIAAVRSWRRGSRASVVRRPLTAKEQKRRLWRQMRASLLPMSGRQWVKIRKFAQRQAKLRTQYAAAMRQRQAAR